MQRTKIEIYVKRSFSEKMTATFDFLTENGKQLFRFLLYLLLPLSMVQALGTNMVMDSVLDIMHESWTDGGWIPMVSGYAVVVLAGLAGFVLCTSVVYGLMKVYNERPERLEGLTLRMFRPTLVRCAKRSLLLLLLLVGMGVVVIVALGALAALVVSRDGLLPFLILFYLLFLVCLMPLSLSLPAYLWEDTTLFGAISKAFRLGFKTWGGLFALVFVLGMVVYFIVIISYIPWYIMLGVKAVFVLSDETKDTWATTPFYTLGWYLVSVVQAFFTYVASTLMYIGIGIQYGHAVEKIDGISVVNDVDNFENL